MLVPFPWSFHAFFWFLSLDLCSFTIHVRPYGLPSSIFRPLVTSKNFTSLCWCLLFFSRFGRPLPPRGHALFSTWLLAHWSGSCRLATAFSFLLPIWQELPSFYLYYGQLILLSSLLRDAISFLDLAGISKSFHLLSSMPSPCL